MKILSNNNKRKKSYKAYIKENDKLKEKVLEELCNIAFDDLGNYISIKNDENGENVVEIKNSAHFDTRNISEITQNKNGLKFKLYNKENALVRLGNYLGLWKEKVEAEAEDLDAVQKMLDE